MHEDASGVNGCDCVIDGWVDGSSPAHRECAVLCCAVITTGMREPSANEWSDIIGMPAANVHGSKRQSMLPATRSLLNAFYARYNERLAHSLQDDRYLWHLQPQPAQEPASEVETAMTALTPVQGEAGGVGAPLTPVQGEPQPGGGGDGGAAGGGGVGDSDALQQQVLEALQSMQQQQQQQQQEAGNGVGEGQGGGTGGEGAVTAGEGGGGGGEVQAAIDVDPPLALTPGELMAQEAEARRRQQQQQQQLPQ